MKVVGLDVSQTGTGIAIHEPGGVTFTRTVGEEGKRTDTLLMRHERMERAVQWIAEWIAEPDLVVIESHDFGGKLGNMHDRSGLWWSIVRDLIQAGIPVAQVPPATLKAYLTGNGRASKEDMLVHVVRRYPTIDVRNNNEADALGLLSMGVRHLELIPLEDAWNQKMDKAMNAVAWP